MGITGLIPFVKKSTKEVDLQTFSGHVVAVDAYCWLHKGAFAYAEKLVKGEKTDGYVIYCMKYVNMMLNCGLKPILVFDGQRLPSKAETERKRRESRAAAKQKGKALLSEGKHSEAVKYFQSAVDVTSSMALELIQACRSVNVDCIVAPYEADAQLAYLGKSGIAQIVITEDSDLIAFGCEKVLFKLTLEGRGLLYDRSILNETLGAKADQFTLDRFRQMCILSGCDYLQNLPGIGLGKAFQFFSKLKPSADVYSIFILSFACALARGLHLSTERGPRIKRGCPPLLYIMLDLLYLKFLTNGEEVFALDKALPLLPNYLKKPNLVVPKEYKTQFEQADNTFLYQLVYDPISRNIVPLNPYPTGKNASDFPYAGLPTTPKKAFNLAVGNLDVNTLEAMDYYDPDDHEANITLRQSYSWSNSLKRASHPSIWRQGYSSQEVFRSPRKTLKKSPRKLAFTATSEKTLVTSFVLSPRKKRSGNGGDETKEILSQYCTTSEVSSVPPSPSPEKPKKLRIETDYSSVEWTPTKIRRKESGTWSVEDEEDPIGTKRPEVAETQVAKKDENQTPVSIFPDKPARNPFVTASGHAPQTKRMAYSALSMFEKMRMSRTESNQIVVTSKYFSSESGVVEPGKKRRLEEEDRSCFDYLKTSETILSQNDSAVGSEADSAVSTDSPSSLLALITPEKHTNDPTDRESPILSSKMSARRLSFTSTIQKSDTPTARTKWSSKKVSKKSVSLKERSTQRDLFQSFAYQKSVSFGKVKSKSEQFTELGSDKVVVLTSDEESESIGSSVDTVASNVVVATPEKVIARPSPVKSPVFERRSSFQGSKLKSSTKQSGKLKALSGKQTNLFELFGRKK